MAFFGPGWGELNRFAAARSIDGLVFGTRCIAEPGPKIAKTTHVQ